MPKYWVKNKFYTLTQEDEAIILSPTDWLNDNIVNAAQVLLKQLSHYSGFQNTLLGSTLQFAVERGEFVQIIHDGINHWLMISNVGGSCVQQVMVYDSMHRSVGSCTKRQVAVLLHTNQSHIKIQMMDIHLQSGGSDCGLFAIANATALVYGLAPGSQLYNQAEMRRHLWRCLKEGNLIPFPILKTRRCTGLARVKSTDIIKIYCSCRMPDSGHMIQCSNCREWYHIRCVQPSKKSIDNKSTQWLCRDC